MKASRSPGSRYSATSDSVLQVIISIFPCCVELRFAAIPASLRAAWSSAPEEIMRKRSSKSQEHVVFPGQFAVQAAVRGDWTEPKERKRDAEDSFYSERTGEPNRSDLARLYYHLRTPTPDNPTVPRRLRPLSLVSTVKAKSRTVTGDGEEIVDQMEIRLQQTGSLWESLDVVEAGWTQVERAVMGEAREWTIAKRLITAYRRIATSALRAYEEGENRWQAHRCPQASVKPAELLKETSIAEQLIKQTEAKRQLEELEDFLEADAEAYKELQSSIESLLQVHSSGTAEYLRQLYHEMSQKHALPEPNHFTELPPMELQQWENSLRQRFQ